NRGANGNMARACPIRVPITILLRCWILISGLRREKPTRFHMPTCGTTVAHQRGHSRSREDPRPATGGFLMRQWIISMAVAALAACGSNGGVTAAAADSDHDGLSHSQESA